MDPGATTYFARSRGKPRSEKSSAFGKAVSTILVHSCALPSWIWNSNSSQNALIIT
jgi:hypothetical protein